jgi:hypothetical protein
VLLDGRARRLRQAVIVSDARDAAEVRAATCSFCGGPASGSGEAKLLVHSKLGPAAVCGRCIESHAELLHELNERRRRQGGDT